MGNDTVTLDSIPWAGSLIERNSCLRPYSSLLASAAAPPRPRSLASLLAHVDALGPLHLAPALVPALSPLGHRFFASPGYPCSEHLQALCRLPAPRRSHASMHLTCSAACLHLQWNVVWLHTPESRHLGVVLLPTATTAATYGAEICYMGLAALLRAGGGGATCVSWICYKVFYEVSDEIGFAILFLLHGLLEKVSGKIKTVALPQQITSHFVSFLCPLGPTPLYNPLPDSVPLDIYSTETDLLRLTESVLGSSCDCDSTPLAAPRSDPPADGSSDGRGGARRPPARPDGGRRPGRAGRAGERPPDHRARPIRRRRAQHQEQRVAGVREAGESEGAGGGREHALLHHRGQGRRRQEALRGQGLGEGVGELQAAPGIQAGRLRCSAYIYVWYSS